METLDYDLVKSKMDELNKIFTDYDKILTDINTSIGDGINNGEESAILSSLLGESFLKQWDETASSFKGLKNKFDNVYADVGQVTKNTADLEDRATSLFYSKGGTSSVSGYGGPYRPVTLSGCGGTYRPSTVSGCGGTYRPSTVSGCGGTNRPSTVHGCGSTSRTSTRPSTVSGCGGGSHGNRGPHAVALDRL